MNENHGEDKNKIFDNSGSSLSRLLFNHVTDSVIIAGDFKISHCNDAALRFFGARSFEDMVGKFPFENSPILQGDGTPSLLKADILLKNLPVNQPQQLQWTFLKANGSAINTEVTVHRFSAGPGDDTCIIIREADNANELVQRVIEAIPQPVFIKDRNLVYTHCNQAFAGTVGRTKPQIIGTTIIQPGEGIPNDPFSKADQYLLTNGGYQLFEAIINGPNDSTHNVIFHKNALVNQSGENIGIIGFIEDVTSLRKKIQELETTETKYKKIFTNVQDIFYQTDLDGRLVEISPSISKYSDYIKTDIIGKEIEQFYDNPEERKELIKKLYETGEVLDYEVLLKGKDGQKIWASLNAHLLYDAEGNVTGIEGTIRDVNERKHAEEKLKLSLSLLQATLDSTTEGILVVDMNGKVTSYNNQFKQMFNFPEQIVTWKDDSRFLEFTLDQFKNPEAFLSKVHYLYEHSDLESFDVLELNDGRTIERNSRPQLLDGVPIGRVWSFKDVTQRKKAEAQLRLMAHAIRSINECISITDTQNKILFVNEAFLQTYGYRQEELIGQDIAMVRSDQNERESLRQILDLTIETGWKGELINQRKDGTEFPISLSTTVIKNEENEIIGLVGVAVDISERKKIENELRESEERYRAFFNGSPDAILLAEIESGIIIDANPAAGKLLKRPVGQIIGMHQSQIHPPQHKDNVQEAFREDSKKELHNQTPSELIILCSDGSEIPVEILANQIQIKGKKVLQGVFRDVSERKRAEKALQESETRYRQLVENQGEGVSIVDPQENFVFANPAAESIFGVKPGQLLGRNLRDFIPEQQFKKILEQTSLREQNEKSSYEIEIVTPLGVRKDILVTATPQVDEKGRYNGTFGVFRDITDRKLAEEMLRQSEEKYRNLIETMPDGVYRSSPEGKFLEVNPAMVKMLGYATKEELLSIDIKTQLYFSPEDRESLIVQKDKELDVYPVKKKDGSTVWVEDHGWFIKDQNGNIIFHEGISRDITERKMAEFQLQKYAEELEKLNATKDKFFSIIAHDIKTPFNSILGLSELIKEDARHMDVGTIEQYAGAIFSTSKNTFRLLENLLEWARIQQSHIPFKQRSLILKSLVDDATELMSEKIASKKIHVQNKVQNGVIVLADEDMLKAILRNLISNALKFTPTGGQIEINAMPDADEVIISVKDTGVGIKAENIDKIFKIDSNFTQRGTENEIGTGLGLILCREFVEKHHGRIWVESEEGKGSKFQFTLPQNSGN